MKYKWFVVNKSEQQEQEWEKKKVSDLFPYQSESQY